MSRKKTTRFFIFPRRLIVDGTDRFECRVGKQEVYEHLVPSAIPDLHPKFWPLVYKPFKWVN